MTKTALCTALLTALASLPLLAQAHPCPDVQASPVEARSTTAGPYEKCGVGISLFGLNISLFGPECPAVVYHYPAHAKCEGEPAVGFRCVPDGILPVIGEKCECVELTVIGSGLLWPDCECDVSGNAGYVETFRTETCRQ